MPRVSIVCYLDPKTERRVRSIQQKIALSTGSRASLTEWKPHLTVGDGIIIPKQQQKQFFLKVKAALGNMQTIPFETADFSGKTKRKQEREKRVPPTLFS